MGGGEGGTQGFLSLLQTRVEKKQYIMNLKKTATKKITFQQKEVHCIALHTVATAFQKKEEKERRRSVGESPEIMRPLQCVVGCCCFLPFSPPPFTLQALLKSFQSLYMVFISFLEAHGLLGNVHLE